MLIITLKKSTCENKRRFLKNKRNIERCIYEHSTVFIKYKPHYVICVTENEIKNDEFINKLFPYKNNIIVTREVEKLDFPKELLFDYSDYLKHSAFKGLLRFLKNGKHKNQTVGVFDEKGSLIDIIPEILPFVKNLTVYSQSNKYSQSAICETYYKYGVKYSVRSKENVVFSDIKADFDCLNENGSVNIEIKGIPKLIFPEYKKSGFDGDVNKLREMGIDDKYIFSAFFEK